MSIPMTRDTDDNTRPTDEIAPMIPILPGEPARETPPDALSDGGEAVTPPPEGGRPRDTSYATEATQHTEEIVPFVPDLTGSDEQ